MLGSDDVDSSLINNQTGDAGGGKAQKHDAIATLTRCTVKNLGLYSENLEKRACLRKLNCTCDMQHNDATTLP